MLTETKRGQTGAEIDKERRIRGAELISRSLTVCMTCGFGVSRGVLGWLCTVFTGLPYMPLGPHETKVPTPGQHSGPESGPTLRQNPLCQEILRDCTPTHRTDPATTALQGGACSSKAAPGAWCSAPPANAAPEVESPRPL